MSDKVVIPGINKSLGVDVEIFTHWGIDED